MLEPEKHCISIVNGQFLICGPSLPMITPLADGAETMATKYHKQGSSPCQYVRARQAITSHQHTDSVRLCLCLSVSVSVCLCKSDAGISTSLH